MQAVSVYQFVSALAALAAAAAYLNYRVLRLPPAVGIMAIVLAASAALLALRAAGLLDPHPLIALMRELPFGKIVLHGFLSLLLFAGALHIDLAALREERAAVATLATAGLLIAAAVTAALFWLGARALGVAISPVEALLFGALISPTDPIAVLAVLRAAGVPRRLEARIAGESLFNDGVAVVLFITLLGMSGSAHVSLADTARLLALEVFGGLALGAVAGYAANRLLATVDDYPVEILLTLALALGSYTLAEALHVSAPITVVIAGLLVGGQGRAWAMSERTRARLDEFWELLDYMLNAALFALIGLQVLALDFGALRAQHAVLVCATIAIVLLARTVGVAVPLALVPATGAPHRQQLALLVWGGVRGGICIALALSLPASPARDVLVAATYVVVVFSMLVQAPTLARLARRLCAPAAAA